mgnify:CR=1 FL=1
MCWRSLCHRPLINHVIGDTFQTLELLISALVCGQLQPVTIGVEKINRIKKEKAKDIQVCFVAINKKGNVGAYALQKGFNFSVYNNEGNKLNDAAYLI